MRVLHLTLSFCEGGRKRAIATLIRGLGDLGVECDLGCLDELGCSPDEVNGLVGETIVLGRKNLLDTEALWRLRRFCRQRRIDLIHTHDAASQFTAALLRAMLPRLPILMTFHRSLNTESARPLDRVRNAIAGVCCAAVVTASQGRRTSYLSENYVPARKVVCIPLGIDLSMFRPDPAVRSALRRELGIADDCVLLGAAGHFGIEKGIDVAIRGYQHMARMVTTTPHQLIVLGSGTAPQRELMAELAGRGPGPVRFLGFRRDIERWFRALDLFVHAPRQEAFGLVLPEAMATALPVVATRVGGIPEIVRDGRSGFVVPSDDPESLADALARLVSDPLLRGQMGQAAQQIAEAEYGAEQLARRHLQLYDDLLAQRRPRIRGLR